MTDDWRCRIETLLALSRRQLFFVGGAPRSGTTWLQEILDVHPQVSCGGEALFPQSLAAPLDAVVAAQAQAITGKNTRIFAHRSAYPAPGPEDADLLIATGILHALERQRAGRDVRAIGEKTPENAFFFPRLKRFFPDARFIAVARDPRDVVSSAWHFFPRPEPPDPVAAKFAFIRLALPSLVDGTRAIFDFGHKHPGDLLAVTYEALKSKPETVVKRLYSFLGVDADEATVAASIARTSFDTMAKAAASRNGAAENGVESSFVEGNGLATNRPFFRRGVVGDWRNTLTPEMGDLVIAEFDWALETFGWRR